MHFLYLSDFQLSRLVQASLRKYMAITAYINEAVIIEDRCLGVFFDPSGRRGETRQPMAESFARQKFKGHGKKGVSGFWKRGSEITLLVASSVEVADTVY